jgi:hypothetical protein
MIWLVGHEGNHTALIFGQLMEIIPESEVDLRRRGEALLRLYNLFNNPSVKYKRDMDDETRRRVEALSEEEIKDEVNTIVETFTTPLLDEQARQAAIGQMKAKIKSHLDSLE